MVIWRKNRTFTIIKLEDEWYVINMIVGDKYQLFLCDQWEGLLKFLKDNKVIR